MKTPSFFTVQLATTAAMLALSVCVELAQAQTLSPSPTIAPSPTPSQLASPVPSPTGTADQGVVSNGEIVNLISRPAAILEGKANRDDIFGAIVGGLKIVKAEIDRAGLKAVGRPLTIFLSATDDDFRYRIEIPLESAPEGKTQISEAVKIGLSPVGKAMRFEHRGAYDDIDSTYDAITAYIDEKGVDALETFIEEYPNDLTSSEDPNTVVLIDVMLK